MSKSIEVLEKQNKDLVATVQLLLDQYVVVACGLTEMVGACLPASVIDRARAVLKEVKESNGS